MKTEIDSMSSACAFLFGLALALTSLKFLGLLSWPWFLVTLPATFPILFFAIVGAIVGGTVAAFYWVELLARGIRS